MVKHFRRALSRNDTRAERRADRQRLGMKLAITAAFAATMSILCSADALAGESAQCHVAYVQPRCFHRYGDCRVDCGKPAFRSGHRSKSRRTVAHHLAPSHHYDYARESEGADGGHAAQEQRELVPPPSPPAFAPIPAAPNALAQPYMPAPPASVFNFYGPTNNFFGPVYGVPFPSGGLVPPEGGGRDYRLDPWHGYDPNNGPENGY